MVSVTPIRMRCRRCEPFGLDETATHYVGLRLFFLFTDWRGGAGDVKFEFLCRQHAESIVRMSPRVVGVPFLEIRVISFECLDVKT